MTFTEAFEPKVKIWFKRGTFSIQQMLLCYVWFWYVVQVLLQTFILRDFCCTAPHSRSKICITSKQNKNTVTPCSTAELANSIENAIAIAFLSTIAIAIDKAIFQLLLLLLLLIRASSNYWHFNRNYCFTVLAWNAVFLVSKYTFWSQMHSRLNEDAFLR